VIVRNKFLFITRAGCTAAGGGRAFNRVCLFVCLFVCALKEKRLELSTPNFVHVLLHSSLSAYIDPEVKRSKGQDHTITKTFTVARLLVTRAATAVAVCCSCRRGSACRYDCLCFLVIVSMLLSST